jgi:hypothetical protein
VYVPEKQMSIDECMIAWKGWLIFKVCMPGKPRLVCELQRGYICNMEVYTGKSQSVKNLVLELLGVQLLSKGDHLYQDSYYNSVELGEMLLEKKKKKKKKRVCGILCLDRGVPRKLKKKLKEGESTFCCKDQILVQVW